MANAIVIHEYGASEVLRLERVDVAAPGANQLFIRQTAIGVHFHDIYVRTGLYKTLALPGTPGLEATGVVEEIGPGPSPFDIGDRVVYVTSGYGAYASHRVIDGRTAIKLPDFVSDPLMATNFSRLLTAQMLTDKVTTLKANQTVLVTAATGGVGRLLCQHANAIGARVIGTVSTAEKAKLAKSYGCAYALVYGAANFRDTVCDITDGRGVDIVYDSVGAKTFETSLSVLKFCGHVVNFGQSSGPVDPVAMSQLAEKSLTITRPILFHYLQDPAAYQAMAAAVFKSFAAGAFVLPDLQGIDLACAPKAHDILESGNGGGSLYLTP